MLALGFSETIFNQIKEVLFDSYFTWVVLWQKGVAVSTLERYWGEGDLVPSVPGLLHLE
jgi:hypothetical protein